MFVYGWCLAWCVASTGQFAVQPHWRAYWPVADVSPPVLLPKGGNNTYAASTKNPIFARFAHPSPWMAQHIDRTPNSAPQRALSIRVVLVGDVLLHQPLHQQALHKEDGHRSLWRSIVPLFAQADIGYANLEGPMARGITAQGRSVSDPGMVFDKRVYTSYPMFNYHDTLAQDLRSSGIDVVSTANNHALDRHSIGADKTLDVLAHVGLAATGTRRSNDTQSSWAARLHTSGWTVSFVACTEHTNGIPDTKQQVLLCNNPQFLHTIAQEAQKSDVVIAVPHWGDEYQTMFHPRQKMWAEKMLDAGATMVAGSHPHVVQPIRWTTTDTHAGWVAYSMGNFVSGQFHRQNTQVGQLLDVVFSKTQQGGVHTSLRSLPLRMTRTGSYQVVVNGAAQEHTGGG